MLIIQGNTVLKRRNNGVTKEAGKNIRRPERPTQGEKMREEILRSEEGEWFAIRNNVISSLRDERTKTT